MPLLSVFCPRPTTARQTMRCVGCRRSRRPKWPLVGRCNAAAAREKAVRLRGQRAAGSSLSLSLLVLLASCFAAAVGACRTLIFTFAINLSSSCSTCLSRPGCSALRGRPRAPGGNKSIVNCSPATPLAAAAFSLLLAQVGASFYSSSSRACSRVFVANYCH